MGTVFLVSSLDLIHADTESVYLHEALTKRGFKSKIVCWDDPDIEWEKANLVISRTTSTYFSDPPSFLKWAQRVEETSTLWNTSPVMEWNHHKRYLMQLQKNGVPVYPTPGRAIKALGNMKKYWSIRKRELKNDGLKN